MIFGKCPKSCTPTIRQGKKKKLIQQNGNKRKKLIYPISGGGLLDPPQIGFSFKIMTYIFCVFIVLY